MKNMRSSYKTERIDFSNGPIFKNIVFFALPLIFTNLLQVLYSVSDTVIVSMSDEPDAVGAIGTTAAMINLIVNLFIGCSVGAKVAAGKKLGAEDSIGASTVAHTAMTVGIIFGAACGLIGFFTSEPLIKAMGNAGRLLEFAVLYSKIYFLGVPFISVTNFACALIHADGDTKTPLRVLSLAGMLNVILNVISVKCFKRSVDGMAIATVISNAVSAILLTLKLAGSEYRFDLRRCGIDKEAFLSILHIGLPAAVQSALFSLSHMVIQSSIVTLNNAAAGADAAFQPIVKGSAAVASIESFGFTTVNATAQAAISFVARNDGAKNYRRIRLGMLYCYISVFLLAAVFAALMLIFRESMLSLYKIKRGVAGSLDAIAFDTACARMLCMFILYFLLGFMEVGAGVMQGLGHSLMSSIVSLTGSVVFRILWIFTVFKAFPSAEVIFLSYPISWLLTSFMHYLCITRILKKKTALQNASQ